MSSVVYILSAVLFVAIMSENVTANYYSNQNSHYPQGQGQGFGNQHAHGQTGQTHGSNQFGGSSGYPQANSHGQHGGAPSHSSNQFGGSNGYPQQQGQGQGHGHGHGQHHGGYKTHGY